VWFVALCWNNVDLAVMRLLLKQVQFGILVLLTFWVILMEFLQQLEIMPEPLSALCFSLVLWSPLFMVLWVRND
jgi:hypothetical protein